MRCDCAAEVGEILARGTGLQDGVADVQRCIARVAIVEDAAADAAAGSGGGKVAKANRLLQ